MFTPPTLLLMAFFGSCAVAAVLVLIFLGSLRFPKEVFVYKGGSHKWVPVADPTAATTVSSMRRARRVLRLSIGPIILVLGAFIIWFSASGALADTEEAKSAELAAEALATQESVVAASVSQFIDPLTMDEAADALGCDERPLLGNCGSERKVYDFVVVLPDGAEKTVAFSAGYNTYPDRSLTFKTVSDEDAESLAAAGWVPDAVAQRTWRLRAETSALLEERYGTVLTAAQREALAFPERAPENLTRYGTVEVTTVLADGTYFNGTATLIWDGDFKLIGSEGTDHAAELTRQ